MAVNFKELKNKIKGVVHVVMTPFDKDGDLDEKALRISVNHVAEALKGQDAVFLTTGSIGEFYAMTDEECKTVIRVTAEELDGRFPVFAGTGRSGTRRTIELSQYAQQVGADGVMVLNPYYQPVTEEGLYRHFSRCQLPHTAITQSLGYTVTSEGYISPITPHLRGKLIRR